MLIFKITLEHRAAPASLLSWILPIGDRCLLDMFYLIC